MHKSWWKILTVILLFYTFIGGLLFTIPQIMGLEETARNLYFHVPMWFAMMIILIISVVNAIIYLRSNNLKHDLYSKHFATMGIVFGILGYSTGIIWMLYTWADPNKPGTSLSLIMREPKLIGAALALLIYFAYLVLRDSINDLDKKARISAVYNIFAFALLFPTLWIIPRILPSLHPGGSDGNPALEFKAADIRLRMVFYPAVLGWTLLGIWIATLKIRVDILKEKKFAS